MRLPDGSPALIRKRFGKGWVFVVASAYSAQYGRAVPDALLGDLARRYLPFEVEGNVETLINRTRDGWMALLVNNDGIRKRPKEREQIDSSRTAGVRIRLTGRKPGAEELLGGGAVQTEAAHGSRAWDLRLRVPPGEMRLLRIGQ
jgi:hypothetical protein